MPPAGTKEGKATGKNFKVLHHLVGPWPRGYVISLDQIRDHEKTIDIDRLINLNAVEPTDEDVTPEPAPPGPENRQILVDPTGRVLDAHGLDRPDVAGRVHPRELEERRQQTSQRAGVDPDTLEETEESAAGAENVEPGTDIRARPGLDLSAGQPKAYKSMKVEDLRTEATGRNIAGAESMRKADLIAALEADDAANEQ